jgi:hypothetical protein
MPCTVFTKSPGSQHQPTNPWALGKKSGFGKCSFYFL